MNKYWRAHELFPLMSKEEKRLVFFPTKEERSKKITKADLRINKEDEEILNKYRVK